MSIENSSSSPAEFFHRSVLLKQCVEGLHIVDGGLYVDATLGGGGHSLAILNAAKDVHIIGIDRDPHAIQAAKTRLQDFSHQCTYLSGTFLDCLSQITSPVHGILFDLGVSSPQLDHAHRGFSFASDGPLDMRMNPLSGSSAADLINTYSEKDLANIIYRYGEEPRSRRIAKAICAQRPFYRTLRFAECVRIASGYHKSKNHPATRTFQAIRIAVNNELAQLQDALPKALSLLKPHGRLAVISFHSLEDRIVKQFFQKVTGKITPKDAYGNPIHPPQAVPVCYKGMTGKEFDSSNPRARSARLRIISKSPTSSHA